MYLCRRKESRIRQYLGSKECGDTEESHVGASHTSLGVEGVEPLSREDQRLHGSPLDGPLTKKRQLRQKLFFNKRKGKTWLGGKLTRSLSARAGVVASSLAPARQRGTMAANYNVFRRSCSINKKICIRKYDRPNNNFGMQFLAGFRSVQACWNNLMIALPKRLRWAVEHLEMRKFVT